jgi:hypothetical protein
MAARVGKLWGRERREKKRGGGRGRGVAGKESRGEGARIEE